MSFLCVTLNITICHIKKYELPHKHLLVIIVKKGEHKIYKSLNRVDEEI